MSRGLSYRWSSGTTATKGPKFFACWHPPEAVGPWFGFFGQLNLHYPGVKAAGGPTLELARKFLKDEGEQAASEANLRYCLPNRFG